MTDSLTWSSGSVRIRPHLFHHQALRGGPPQGGGGRLELEGSASVQSAAITVMHSATCQNLVNRQHCYACGGRPALFNLAHTCLVTPPAWQQCGWGVHIRFKKAAVPVYVLHKRRSNVPSWTTRQSTCMYRALHTTSALARLAERVTACCRTCAQAVNRHAQKP